MRGGAVRRAGRYLGLTVATGISAAAGAQDAQTGLLLSTGVSAESNPYNLANGRTGAIAATAEVQPWARFRRENATLDIRGLAQFRQFVRRYGLEDNYAVDADLASRLTERVSLRSSAGIAYTEGGFGYGRPGLSPVGDVGLLPEATAPSAPIGGGASTPQELTVPGSLPLLTDATLLGARIRTTSAYARAGADAVLSSRSQVSVDVDARALRTKGQTFNDFNTASVEARYNRTLTQSTSVGLIGSISRSDYLSSRSGDTTTTSALLSLDRRLGSRWSLSLSAGASFSDIRQLPGRPNVNLTALTVRGRFCTQPQYSQLCISGQRSPQPSAIGGVRVTDTLGADYTRRLNDRERLTFTAAYTRTGRGQGDQALLPAAKFASASARYDNQIGERSTLFASGSVAKVYGDFANRRTNLGVAAGIQFRLGALR